jgi:cyanophycinase
MRKFLIPVLVALVLPAAAPADPTAPAPRREPPAAIPGALVIGGGDLPEPARRRFLELAGGTAAHVVVLTAESNPSEDKLLDPWKKEGVAAAVLLHGRSRADADEPGFVRPLAEATGVWLEGDDPARLAAAYRGTAVAQELRKVAARGGVVGGGAAAAAVGSLALAPDGPPGTAEEGLDLLPGAVLEGHLLRRNRVDRLVRVVARHPGSFGLGIDEGAAVVVKDRRVTVLGDSYALTCLSASATRPARLQVLKAGNPADLIALGRAARARAQAPFPPEKPDPPDVARGALIIGGGGGLDVAVWKRFIELAGGPDSLIVVVPTANDDPVPADPIEARLLRRAGAKNIKVIHTRSRKEADSPEFVAPLREAKGVWFTGGRQWRFVDAYEGTAAERAFHDVLARGGVIGGSSAGASIQTEYMPRGDPLGNLNIIAEGYERGFGFLKGVAVDQHFFARGRPHDMTELVDAYPQLLGLGLDEGTAVLVRGTVLEVLGKGRVAVYDRRKPAAAGQKDYEELGPNARYDLKERKRLDAR